MEQIVSVLAAGRGALVPQRGEMRNVRIVGHTPKNDHYIYDAVMEFANGGERLAIKVFRANRCGVHRGQESGGAGAEDTSECPRAGGSEKARREFPGRWEILPKLGRSSAKSFPAFRLQSIIMKAALLPGYADWGTLTIRRQRHRRVAAQVPPGDCRHARALRCGRVSRGFGETLRSCKKEGLDDLSIRTS